MSTDISIENQEKIIIDARYYPETFLTRYNRENIHSANQCMTSEVLSHSAHAIFIQSIIDLYLSRCEEF